MSLFLGHNTDKGRVEFDLGGSCWCDLQRLALEYGWEPEGTTEPIRGHGCYDLNLVPDGWDDDWCGSYTLSEWQLVSATDAQALGNALQAALDDAVDHEANPKFKWDCAGAKTNDEWANRICTQWDDLDDDRYYIRSSREIEGKDAIKAMIEFSRLGEFRIY